MRSFMDKDSFQKIVDGHSLVSVNDRYYLTHKQVKVLEQFKIPYRDFKSAKDLLFYLNYFDDEELDEVALEIASYSYYQEMQK